MNVRFLSHKKTHKKADGWEKDANIESISSQCNMASNNEFSFVRKYFSNILNGAALLVVIIALEFVKYFHINFFHLHNHKKTFHIRLIFYCLYSFL